MADVTCKQQVNLVNTWLTVDAAYQAVLVGKDLPTLSRLQAGFSSILRRAETLLTLPALPAPGKQRPGPRGRPIKIGVITPG